MKKISLPCLLLLVSIFAFSQTPKVQHVRIGTQSVGSPEVRLKLVARMQALFAAPGNKADVYDKAIYT